MIHSAATPATMAPAASRRGPLRVLLTTDVVGGVWDFTLQLARGLHAAGHEATLLAFGEPTPDHLAEAARGGVTLEFAPLRLEWMQDSLEDVRCARELVRCWIKQHRPDVLHANQFAFGDLQAGVPVILTAHSDMLSWQRWTGWKVQIPPGYLDWVRNGIAGADVVVAVSRFLSREIQELFAVERPLDVIRNGWPDAARPSLPVTGRPRISVLAGRAWDEAKNLSLAVRATESWNPGKVVHAGSRTHSENGGAIDFGPVIEPLGVLPRGDLDRLLSSARVYVAPARYEPFGLLPLQAALHGCPLLLSDIPAHVELWTGAAMFFPSDDPDGLRDAWQRLLADDAESARLAAIARARAKQLYSLDLMVQRYLDRYDWALAQREEEQPRARELT